MLQIRFQITRCKNYRNRFRFAIAKSLTEVYCQVFSGPRCMIRYKYDDIALFSFVRLSSLWDSDILSQHRLTVWHGWILQISAVVVVANIHRDQYFVVWLRERSALSGLSIISVSLTDDRGRYCVSVRQFLSTIRAMKLAEENETRMYCSLYIMA